jgi:hypothetical protein
LRKEGKLKNWLLPVNDVTDINLYDYSWMDTDSGRVITDMDIDKK